MDNGPVDANSTSDRLIADLDEAIDLLQNAGETFWQAWLQRGRDQIASGNGHGLDHLLPGFGGMGSFNDLVLSQPNVPSDRREEFRLADHRLADLRESIGRNCRELKHQLAD